MKASFQTLVSALFLASTFAAASPIPFDPPTGDECLKNPTKPFCGAGSSSIPFRRQTGLPSTGTAIGDACLKNPTSAFCGMGGMGSTSGILGRQLPSTGTNIGDECLKNPTSAFCGAGGSTSKPGLLFRQLPSLDEKKLETDCMNHPTEAFCGDLGKRSKDAAWAYKRQSEGNKFLECQKTRDPKVCGEFFAENGPKRDLSKETTGFLAYANDCDKHPEHCDIPTKAKRQDEDEDAYRNFGPAVSGN